jgi:hypothetical protein
MRTFNDPHMMEPTNSRTTGVGLLAAAGLAVAGLIVALFMML